MMKMKFGAILASAIAIAAAATTPSHASTAGEVHLFTFGDYFSPEVLKDFEAKTGIHVTVNTYDSNDQMLSKLLAGASGYDVALGGNWIMPAVIKKGLAERIEASQFPNYKNLKADIRNVPWDDGRHYSVPFLWGTTGITIDPAAAKQAGYDGPLDSWALVLNPPEQLKGKLNSVPEMQELMNAASLYKGLPLCSANKADLKTLQDTLVAAKRNWVAMSYSVNDDMVSHKYLATVNWNGASWRERTNLEANKQPPVTYVYPKEGLVTWSDSVFIVKGAPNLEAAKKLLDFIMLPEEAAKLSTFAGYDNSVEGSHAFMPKELTEAPEIVPPAGFKTVWAPSCSDEVMRTYGKIWEKVLK